MKRLDNTIEYDSLISSETGDSESSDEEFQGPIDRLDEETETNNRLADSKDVYDKTSRSDSDDRDIEIHDVPIEFVEKAAA